MQNLQIFRTFNDVELAKSQASTLLSGGLQPKLIDSTSSVDLTMTGNPFHAEVRLMLPAEDFEIANQLLLEQATKELDTIDPEHPLLEFTDDELIEVLTTKDEWSATDYAIASKLLNDRGVEINLAAINQKQNERLATLAKPEKVSMGWIIAGYITTVFGGILPLFLGWHYAKHKKTLPNGERVYAYDEASRNHGKKMYALGVICAITFGLIWAWMKTNHH